MKFALIILLLISSFSGLCQEGSSEHDIHEFEGKQAEMPETLDEASPVAGYFDELKKLGHSEINLKTFNDPKAIPWIKKILSESKIDQIPEAKVKLMLKNQFKGTIFDKIFNLFPVTLDIFTAVVRDSKAMPSLIGIFGQRGLLKIFFCVWFATLLLFYYLRKVFISPNAKTYVKIPASILFSLSFSAVSFMIFYYMFTEEVDPTVKVIQRFL